MSNVASEQAYEEGQQAYRDGGDLGDCPYSDGSLNGEMWASGFKDAENGDGMPLYDADEED